jgi:hypothetical protein
MTRHCCQTPLSADRQDHEKRPDLHLCGAPGGIRTPNLLIRSQMLYPLSYGRLFSSVPPTGTRSPR